MRKVTTKIFALIMAFAVVACAPKNNSTSPTGGDAGGGEIDGSSEAQVKKAISDAHFYIGQEEIDGDQGFFGTIKNIEKTLPEEAQLIFETNKRSKNQLEDFKKSRISFDMASCSKSLMEKHAAVSSHRVGATICMNVKELQKIPPSNLYKEITALLIHEHMHILGFGENEAKMMQKLAIKAWPIMESEDNMQAHNFLMAELSRAMTFLNNTVMHLGKKDNEKGKIASELAQYSLLTFKAVVRGIGNRALIKVKDPRKLSKLFRNVEDASEHFWRTIRNSNNMDEVSASASSTFCSLANLYMPLRKSLYIEDIQNFREHAVFSAGDSIRLFTTENVVSCEGIPKEIFDNSAYNRIKK